MRKRKTYDVNLKLSVANEYAEGGTTYAQLEAKYDIPRSTLAKWVLKHKKYNVDPQRNIPQKQAFLNVTEALVATNKVAEHITIVINGLELKSDITTLIRLLQGAKDV